MALKYKHSELVDFVDFAGTRMLPKLCRPRISAKNVKIFNACLKASLGIHFALSVSLGSNVSTCIVMVGLVLVVAVLVACQELKQKQ